MSDDELNPGWFRHPEYLPAIQLCLNYEAGHLEIHDTIYSEEYDAWFVELTDTRTGYYDMGFKLQGRLVRTAFKALERGPVSWSKPPSKKPQTSPILW